MKIGVRALGLSGLLIAALYFSQPIQDWLLRAKAGYDRTQRQRALVAVNTHFAAMNSALASIMATVLSENPSFSRVHVATIHNQNTTDITTPLVLDLVSSLVVAGHKRDDVGTNIPIEQMNDYLGTLLKRECAYVAISAISNPGTVARMRSHGIEAFLGCPIVNENNELLGVIYGEWDLLTEVPDNLEPIKQRLMRSAKKIGSTIKLVN